MASSANSKITIGDATLDCSVVITESGYRDTENTNSSHSATNFEPVIPNNMVEVDIPWDPTNTPESIGFVPGTQVDCTIYDGSTGLTVDVAGALVGPHRRVRDVANDIIRSKFMLKGGTHTPT